ncbi:MAG TPA: hypothetical protein VLD16_11065 [Gaiellaceae bacterium]|nr:hypothetical protein [Gaiellaceae bacterium]
MTGKSAFTDEEWEAIAEGPPIAGMYVLTAEHGGSFRESFALAKAYAEAREQHGESEVLDAVVGEKPHVDRHRYGTPEALRTDGVERLRQAVGALESKGTPDDVQAYQRFVLDLARRVAEAHKEHDHAISASEQEALDAVAAALGVQSAS